MGRAAAPTRRDAARLERGQLCPRTRLTAQAARQAWRPARSAFCRRRIGIADTHHTVLAVAHSSAGFAPGAACLPAQPRLVQSAPDRRGTDLRQPIRSLAQGSLPQAQGPRGRAVLFALGGSRPFRPKALLRVSARADPRSAPMPRPHSGEPVTVEATDPGGEGLVVPSSDWVGCRRGGCAMSDGPQGSGARDLRGRSAERAAQAGQGDPLVRGEGTQRICPVARQGTPRSTRIASPLYQSSHQGTH